MMTVYHISISGLVWNSKAL